MRRVVRLITKAAGVTKIFQRSVEKHGIRYISYYGDGDSKSYEEVKNVYPGITVEKYECIRHYQKWIGNRLRKLRAKAKGLGGKIKKISEKYSTGKVAKVKSWLTDSIIDKLQNYFGIAQRSNIGESEDPHRKTRTISTPPPPPPPPTKKCFFGLGHEYNAIFCNSTYLKWVI